LGITLQMTEKRVESLRCPLKVYFPKIKKGWLGILNVPKLGNIFLG
jgi:hypothetical protein